MTTATVTNPQQLAQASSSSTPAAPSSVTINGSSDFSAAVLAALGLPVTAANIAALNAWQAAEGQWGAGGVWNAGANHNPLNTTQPVPGSVPHYPPGTTVPIQQYPDWTTGVAATVKTLQYPRYAPVLAVLRASAGTAALSAAVVQSGWGTGSFAGNAGSNQPNTAGGSKTATLDVSLGSIAGDVGNAVLPGPLGILPDIASGLGAFGVSGSLASKLGVLSDVTSLGWWKRVAMGAAGVVLIGGGLVLFVASTKPGQDVASAAPLVAAAAL